MSRAAINIVEAMESDAIWRRWFKHPATWRPWRAFLKALFALPMTDAELDLFKTCTGRTAPPAAGALETWLIVGRRGGKSFVLALIACFLACFRDWAPHLSPGERGLVMVIATDRRQARVIFRYCRALLIEVPVLAPLVERADDDKIELANGINIEIVTASFRAVRGHTIVAALLDELAFWRTDETAANPDAEILEALRPAMATVPGAMLLGASSPYARRGVLYDAHRAHYGREDADALVWQAPTRTMNPSVRQSVIDKAYDRDPASAAAEYGAQFRSDIESFVSRDVVAAAVVAGRHELPPRDGVRYVGGVDPSGGSADAMTLSIAHRESDGRVILDAVRERRPPFSPEAVVQEFALLLRDYHIHAVTGDHWGGEFVREPFRKAGIEYVLAELPKSDLYRDMLPLLNAGRVELLDHSRLVTQLCGLERRTARSGKDSIDHALGAHDDVVNSAAIAITLAATVRHRMKITKHDLAVLRRPPRRGYGYGRHVPVSFR
jgi:hypothetical protein